MFDNVLEMLKNCDMSDEHCEGCKYKDLHPNQCIKELHIYARHVLQECYEMAEFYARKAGEK